MARHIARVGPELRLGQGLDMSRAKVRGSAKARATVRLSSIVNTLTLYSLL